MKKYLVALLGLLLLALIIACGGGDSTTATSTNRAASVSPNGETVAPTTSAAPGDLTADIGFRPNKDGYSFANFGNTYPDTPGTLGIEDVVKMFGANAVCENKDATSCNATPGATMWLDAQNKSSNGGHCEGFAVTSLRLFQKLDDATQFGGTSAHDLALTDQLKHYIAFYMASQAVEPVSSTSAAERTKTPKEVLADISTALKAGTDPLTMGIYKQGGGGHAIVPYAIQDKGNGVFWVMVYDNNWPDQERHIEIDVNANTWKYDLAATNPGETAEPWGGDATTFSLDLTPQSVRDTSKWVCPWCAAAAGVADKGMKAVMVSGNANITVTDSSGHTLTYTNGAVQNNIPGATATDNKLALTLTEDNPPALIFLPEKGNYDIHTTSEGISAAEASRSQEEVTIFGSGDAIDISGFDLTGGEAVDLKVSAGGSNVSFKPTATEKVDLKVAHDVAGDAPDYLFDVSNVNFDGTNAVDLNVDDTTGNFAVKDTGGAQDSYDVKVSRDSAAGEQDFSNSAISIDPGETENYDFAAWAGQGSPMSVGDDMNSDGSIDTTVQEPDQQ
jgi:hypothetical protein